MPRMVAEGVAAQNTLVVPAILIDGHPAIISAVPVGMCRVIALYVNPETGKLVVEYDDVPRPPDP